MGDSILQKRKLGQTDIHISVLGLGTVKFGRNQGVKYPEQFNLPTDTELHELLGVANELGINLLDTAPAYGTSEERLGKLLRGKRKQWIIASKAGEEFIDGKSHFDFSSQGIIKSVERSLQRLKTDYLDILLIHSNGEDEHLINDLTVFETLATLKSAGKIRSFGMSTKTMAGGLLTIQQADLAMVSFHPGYLDEQEIIQQAYQQHKGILIKKAFASGHLKEIAEEDPIKKALQFVLNEPGVTSVVVGTINPVHLRENSEAVKFI